MSDRIPRDVLVMCRGFGSTEVRAPGGALRGVLDEQDVEEAVPGYEGQSRLVTRRVLRVPTPHAIAYEITKDATLSIGDMDYVVRDLRREADGALTMAVLAAGARRAA
jgi:hypothetical protein